MRRYRPRRASPSMPETHPLAHPQVSLASCSKQMVLEVELLLRLAWRRLRVELEFHRVQARIPGIWRFCPSRLAVSRAPHTITLRGRISEHTPEDRVVQVHRRHVRRRVNRNQVSKRPLAWRKRRNVVEPAKFVRERVLTTSLSVEGEVGEALPWKVVHGPNRGLLLRSQLRLLLQLRHCQRCALMRIQDGVWMQKPAGPGLRHWWCCLALDRTGSVPTTAIRIAGAPTASHSRLAAAARRCCARVKRPHPGSHHRAVVVDVLQHRQGSRQWAG
jgi:hypothetical protein